MTQIFHPLLAMIASPTDKELAKYIQFLPTGSFDTDSRSHHWDGDYIHGPFHRQFGTNGRNSRPSCFWQRPTAIPIIFLTPIVWM